MNIELIAKTCHEVNKVFCESIGDLSQPKWDDAPQWQKDSAMNGVRFHLENPYSKPFDSHNNWMAEKLKEGWKYGAVKNPETKEHPCMVAYDELSKDQQTKYALFVAVAHSNLFYDEIPDSSMLSTYMWGFKDELNGVNNVTFPNIHYAKSYNLGRMDAIAGDDVRSVDNQNDDEILERIRQSNLIFFKPPIIGKYDVDVKIGKLLNTPPLIMFEICDNTPTTQESDEDSIDDYATLHEIDLNAMIQSKKEEILNHVFNSKDGSSWNELTEMLNELIDICK